MKSRVTNVNAFTSNSGRKILISVDEMKAQFDAEFESRKDKMYEEVEKDVIPQVMAVCFMELNKEFGFGEKRLKQFKRGITGLFAMMCSGVMGKPFTTVDCIDYIQKNFNIDLEEML